MKLICNRCNNIFKWKKSESKVLVDLIVPIAICKEVHSGLDKSKKCPKCGSMKTEVY